MCSAGRRNTVSSICVATHGTGRNRTPMDTIVRRMKNAAFEHHLQMSLEEMSLQTQYYEVKYGDFDVKIRHC